MLSTVPRRMLFVAVLAGAALGVVYTLSPLTILMLPLLVLLARWAARDLGVGERRWLYGVLAVAVGARLFAVGSLFLLARPDEPFAVFFGDEEMFKLRSIWLRNIGLGVPISAADFIYALDETGKSQYLFVLAFIQALVGPAPYGIHLLNMALYLAAALVLHRLVRPSYGRVAAFGGLVVLLFLPSLFIWSVSALKEPLYTLVAAVEIACVLAIVRSRRWMGRVLAIAAVPAMAYVLEGLRKGGLLVAGAGTVVGLTAGFIVARPRLVLATAAVIPLAVAGIVAATGIDERLMSILRDSAMYQVGHVNTPGYSYQTLDVWYYIDAANIHRMTPGDAAAYVIRSLVAYVVQPIPWKIESRAALAYLPEYVVWLTMVALLPAGVITALRRDPLLTCVLVAHGALIVMMVALTSGNVGTLIRHRGLALPYFVWFSALAACHLLARVGAPRTAGSARRLRTSSSQFELQGRIE